MIIGKVNGVVISLGDTPYLVIAIVVTLCEIFNKRQQLLCVGINEAK
jgi:hypothetical protein